VDDTDSSLPETYKKSPVSSSQQAALQKALDARREKHRLKIARLKKEAESRIEAVKRREALRRAALEAAAAAAVAKAEAEAEALKVTHSSLYNLDKGIIVTECQRQRREVAQILGTFVQEMKDFVLTEIQFVHNPGLEEKYESARQKILDEKGDLYGVEKLMFHGTAKKNVSSYNVCH
jgi:hypothetical protein